MNIKKTIGTIIVGGLLFAAGYGIGHLKGVEKEEEKHAYDYIGFSIDEYGKRGIRFNISGRLKDKEFVMTNVENFYDTRNAIQRWYVDNRPSFSWDERQKYMDSVISSGVLKEVNRFDNAFELGLVQTEPELDFHIALKKENNLENCLNKK